MAISVRLLLAAGGACAGLAAPVSADCPQPGDLADGISLRDDSGGVTTFRPGAAPGEVMETTLFDDNTGFFVRSTGGLLVEESHDIENGAPVESTVVDTRFEGTEQAFPVAEGRRLELAGTEVDATGAETAITVLIETSLMRQVLYGDCAVQAIPVRMTYTYGGEASEVEYLDYLPEFGISLFLGAGELGGAPDIYRIVELFKALPQ
ncbi:hypothetical protein [Vannielia litorea]|uniref:hypothetical protein n=1 Tax=Vannielia litorea TaxID=1217970 RepID=UPI001C9734E7|nr:hypothetical protein [Vannielia litorea]MBY6047672.1 hypothetical protein [Vannielia litorea]MBY6075086.1 hypothetical protein [Vannielia litorea]